MQSQNPELVNQLREQMGRPPNAPGSDDQDSDQQPPPPKPGTSSAEFFYSFVILGIKSFFKEKLSLKYSFRNKKKSLKKH